MTEHNRLHMPVNCRPYNQNHSVYFGALSVLVPLLCSTYTSDLIQTVANHNLMLLASRDGNQTALKLTELNRTQNQPEHAN